MADDTAPPVRVRPSITVSGDAGWSLRATELDETSYGEFCDSILRWNPAVKLPPPRTYPGYPRIELSRVKPRILASLDRALLARRTVRAVSGSMPSRKDLSRLLHLSHGVTADGGRGPVPSAGGLQALELYAVVLAEGWLSPGVYHYDRQGHHLCEIVRGASGPAWRQLVPALEWVGPVPVVFLVIGDGARVHAKYGERAYRFLLLEAGHLAQNIALVSASLSLTAIELGGCLEPAIARHLALPRGDAVLHAIGWGRPAGSADGAPTGV